MSKLGARCRTHALKLPYDHRALGPGFALSPKAASSSRKTRTSSTSRIASAILAGCSGCASAIAALGRYSPAWPRSGRSDGEPGRLSAIRDSGAGAKWWRRRKACRCLAPRPPRIRMRSPGASSRAEGFGVWELAPAFAVCGACSAVRSGSAHRESGPSPHHEKQASASVKRRPALTPSFGINRISASVENSALSPGSLTPANTRRSPYFRKRYQSSLDCHLFPGIRRDFHG